MKGLLCRVFVILCHFALMLLLSLQAYQVVLGLNCSSTSTLDISSMLNLYVSITARTALYTTVQVSFKR